MLCVLGLRISNILKKFTINLLNQKSCLNIENISVKILNRVLKKIIFDGYLFNTLKALHGKQGGTVKLAKCKKVWFSRNLLKIIDNTFEKLARSIKKH